MSGVASKDALTELALSDRPRRVVLLDGFAARRGDVQNSLAACGFEVAEVDSVEAAVRAASSTEEPPGCLVLVEGPDLPIAQVLSSLRDGSGRAACPVVVVSACAEQGEAALQAGAWDYVGWEWLCGQSLARAVEGARERWGLARALGTRDEQLSIALQAGSLASFVWDIAADRVTRLPPAPRPAGTFAERVGAVHPEDRAAFEAAVRAALEGDGRYTSRHRTVDADGGVAHVEETGRVELDRAGRPARLVGVARDVTAERRARAEQADDAERLRLALNAARAGAWSFDLRAGRVDWDPETRAIFGLAPDEPLTFDSAFDQFHPDDRAAVRDAYEAATAPTGDGRYDIEHRIVRSGSGEVRWVHSLGRTEFRGEGPAREAVGMAGIVTDVTGRRRSEEALRASEERLRLALEGTDTGLWEWNLATDRVAWSPECYRIHGVAEDAFDHTGRGFFRLVHPDDRARVEATVRAAMAEGTLFECEFRIVRPSGEVAWVADRGRAIPCAGDLRMVGTITDISPRKRAEDEARNREAFIQHVTEVAPCFLYVRDLVEQRDVWGNREVFDGLGYSRADLEALADAPSALLHPDDLPRHQAHLQRLERLAVGQSLEFEYRMRRADGTYRWLHSRDIALELRPDGRVQRIVGAALDITELKEAHAALQVRERELQTLADHTPDVLTRFDRALRYVFVNAAVERATGRPPAEFLGKTHRELGVPPDQCERWDAAISSVFSTGAPRSLEVEHAAPDGIRHYSARLVPELGPGGVVEGVVCVIRDVTAAKRHERALEAQDRRKNEFLATLAHELRNPLAPIRTGLAVLRMGGGIPAEGRVAHTLDMMERQVAHLVRLVDDLMDVARVGEGKVALQMAPVSVAEVVEGAVEACGTAVQAKEHELSVQIPDEPMTLHVDRTRIVQVLCNLLTNAAKYSDPRRRITLRARRDGEWAVISVADEGVGIAAEVLPTLWSMFTQARDTLDKAQGGLGIGLSLVKHLVEAHGGTVLAESEGVGRGSTFSVRLPLVERRAASVERPPAAARAPDAGEGVQVLVVEDHEDAAQALEMMLSLLGHRAALAHSGPEAIEVARRLRPDVALLDVGLPGMDGYEVARRLRADPEHAGMVLVAITGWGSDADRRRALEAGMDLHLVKPVELETLRALLARAREARAEA